MKQIQMLDLRREYEYMKEEIDSAIKKCLDHQKWILGPEVGELERKIAEYIGVKHCVGISYCNRRCHIKGRRHPRLC
ncbi:MAG TPA: DegT/DnrJ/EryC1/StrS family aminotransferase [Thermodesulfovibrionales bacterium]|nr:DegT/DnrJ/EryC1/StrS family aminotransferase [Thermodesulfovibrionales bacterium]